MVRVEAGKSQCVFWCDFRQIHFCCERCGAAELFQNGFRCLVVIAVRIAEGKILPGYPNNVEQTQRVLDVAALVFGCKTLEPVMAVAVRTDMVASLAHFCELCGVTVKALGEVFSIRADEFGEKPLCQTAASSLWQGVL